MATRVYVAYPSGVGASATLADGDYGDIVVSSSGTVFSFDSAVVTTAAKTVLDDTTVAAMVDTLGGATSTGTGGLARATSPTFTTPILGTPTSGTLDNCTAPASIITSGTIATARLGGNVADSTKYLQGDQTWQSLTNLLQNGSSFVNNYGGLSQSAMSWNDGQDDWDYLRSRIYGSDESGTLSEANIYVDAVDGAYFEQNSKTLGVNESGYILSDPTSFRATAGLTIGTHVQAYDADLASWAGVTRASGFDTFVATPSSANLRSLITDETGGSGLAVFNANPTMVGATLTGQLINSTNGALSAPASHLTGTWITGGTATTTKPYVLIEPTGTTSTAWSTSGTGIGVNAASGFTGNLIDLQVGGSSIIKSTSSTLTIAAADVLVTDGNGTVASKYFHSRSKIGAYVQTVFNATHDWMLIGSSTTVTPFSVRHGFSSHTANSQQWQDNTGANLAAIGPAGQITGRVLVEANTAGSGSPNILTVAESRTLLTNEGAGAENYHTLPLAVAGLTFGFYCKSTNGIRIVANTADTIRNAASVSATAGYIRTATEGNYIELKCINATEWITASIIGTWTIDS